MKTHVALTLCAAVAVTLPVGVHAQEAAQPPKAAAAAPVDPKFLELKQRIEEAAGAAKEADLLAFFKLAVDIGRPTEASLAIQGYLREAQNPSPEVVRRAGDVAALAGDYRAAATRYRRYIEGVKAQNPTPEASAVLASLLRLEIDVVRDHASAYRTMREYGTKLRLDPRVGKYDEWFLNLALKNASERRDSVADAANLLDVALAQKLPLEQERLIYWRFLDPVFMGAYAWQLKDPAAALPALTRIAAAVRDDKGLALKYALCVAELQSRASASASTPEAAKAFEPVIVAAQAYTDAFPNSDALRTAVYVLSRGFADAQTQMAARHAFGARAFGKLPPKEKEAILRWDRRGLVMGPAQWIEAGAAQADFFRASPAARNLRIGSELAFDTQDKTLNTADTYRKQATFLKGVESDDAALVNSLAAGADDFNLAIEHFFTQEAWHYIGDPEAAFNALWSAFSKLPRAEPLPKDLYDSMLLKYGARMAATPGVRRFGRQDFYREYLQRAWRTGTVDERVAAMQKFRWVPMEERWMKEAVGGAQEDFRRSGAYMLKQNPPTLTKEEFDRINAAFETLRKPAPEEAPTPECKALVEADRAARERNDARYNETARQLWALVKDARASRKPFAWSTLLWLVEPKANIDSIDLQGEVLAAAMAAGAAADTEAVFNQVLRGRENWLWSPDGNDQPKVRRINAVLHKALVQKLDANTFDADVFGWFRKTRSNQRMRDHESGLDVAEKLIQKRQAGVDLPGAPDVVSLMNLLAYEFAPLQQKYPPATAFEAMAAKEIAATRKLNYGYYVAQGIDATGAVVNEAAKVLLAFDAAPLGYAGQSAPCDADSLWKWYERVLFSGKTDAGLRDQLIAKLNAGYGKTRFDAFAARTYTRFDPATPEGRAGWFTQMLAPYLDRLAASAWQWPMPADFGVLAKFGKPDALSDAELGVLARVFGECALRQADPNSADTRWPGSYGMDVLIRYLHEGLTAKGRQAELFPLIPHFWTWNRDWGTDDSRAYLGQVARQLAEKGELNLAVAYAAGALEIAGGVLKQDVRQVVRQVTHRGTQEFAYIPVPPTDARYPVYKAQVAHKGGNYDLAWDALSQGRNALLTTYRELDPAFTAWAIEALADRQMFDLADQVGREVTRWFDEGSLVDPEMKARIGLAQSHVAFVQKNYPTARARLEQILADQAFAGTQARLTAELQIANIDRLTKDFDSAVRRLDELQRNPSQRVRDDASILMARINFDRGDYKESKELLEEVIQHSPERDDAVLLTGEVDLALRHLMDATDLDRMGEAIARQIIVPGQPLKITLQDEMASVVGHAKAIPVVARSEKAGDEEHFTLMPQGDIRRRFSGVINTALAPVKKDDGTLQVLGEDTVRYDFAPEFAKQQDIKDHQEEALTVKTDAALFASSGRILSREEQEKMALEAEIRATLNLKDGAAVDKPDVALSEVRRLDAVKPGNTINLQVEDPDRSTTHEKDVITLDVASSSGDIVRNVKLTETDAHSGIFSGSLQTAPAQPNATASDTLEGRDANNAISPKTDYDPWVGTPGKGLRTFTVDLSDNYALDTLTLLDDVAGRKIKKLGVQTAFTKLDTFKTVGLWPGNLAPWDGSLQLDLVRYQPPADSRASKGGGPTPDEIDTLIADNELTGELPAISLKLKTATVNLGANAGGHADKLGLADDNTVYAGRLRGAFYIPMARAYTFRLIDANAPDLVEATKEAPLKYQFAVGEQAGVRRGGAQNAGYLTQRAFMQGVHTMTVYFTARRNEPIQFEVKTDLGTPDQSLVVCGGEMFDPAAQPRIRKEIYHDPIAITPSADGTQIQAAFAGARAKLVRLVLLDYEGDAPAIRRLTLAAADGTKILPTAHDYLDLRNNDILEVLSGDVITATYKDPCFINDSRRVHTAKLSVTFTDGTLSPCFVEFAQSGGRTLPRYVPMVRFKPDEPVCVVVRDADLDVSEKLDSAEVAVETVAGDKASLQAVETEPHSGVFVSKVIPVVKDQVKAGELKVAADDTLTITYMDKENLNPGITWPRTATVNSSVYVDPEVRVYSTTSGVLPAVTDPAKSKGAAAAPAPAAGGGTGLESESFRKAFRMVSRRPSDASHNVSRVLADGTVVPPAATGTATRVHIDGPLLVEVLWPTAALSPESELALFAQTSSGREKAGKALAAPFDVSVPGTIMLSARPSAATAGAVPPQYELQVVGDPFAISPLIDGRFTFSIAKALGESPAQSYVDRDDKGGYVSASKEPLYVSGDDSIYVAFRYLDATNGEHWVTEQVVLGGDAMLDIMDRAYQKPIEAIHVGEKLYFRVVDKTRDRSESKDSVSVVMTTSSGHTITNQLMETLEHTGVFKGVITPLFDQAVAEGDTDVLPCRYGDTVTVAYTPADGTTLKQVLTIHKGADGDIQPFSKRFRDPDIAVKTQFAIAEAHFEQAKNHRKLQRMDLAKDEIAQGRRVLEEAMRDFPDFNFRDHAEYLLANLAMEFAGDEQDADARNQLYREAIGKFSQIVVEFPDSSFAPQAQYKKALCYEKLGFLDQACEDYVKLSYQYPEHELIAETIARLGQYFWRKARAIEKQAKPLRESADAKDKIEGEKFLRDAQQIYRTAAEVFSRLGARFPEHELAGKTMVLSAQAWMQAAEFDKSVALFKETVDRFGENVEIAPEAMYWQGEVYFKMQNLPEAYKAWTKLTWDFPKTEWARYARARLSDPVMVRAATALK